RVEKPWQAIMWPISKPGPQKRRHRHPCACPCVPHCFGGGWAFLSFLARWVAFTICSVNMEGGKAWNNQLSNLKDLPNGTAILRPWMVSTFLYTRERSSDCLVRMVRVSRRPF